MTSKYVKPLSVTWWASVIPLGSGMFIALEPVHGLVEWAASVSAMYGDADPSLLINGGLAGIGIRGAIR